LKPKVIYIDPKIDMVNWISENHITINNIIYDHIFDFIEGDDLKKSVLQIIVKPQMGDYNRYIFSGISYEFMLIRDNIDDTIDALIKNFEKLEEFEKCAKLLETKRKFGL
jgi:hypothetical protein